MLTVDCMLSVGVPSVVELHLYKMYNEGHFSQAQVGSIRFLLRFKHMPAVCLHL